jgi:hypothetical protein
MMTHYRKSQFIPEFHSDLQVRRLKPLGIFSIAWMSWSKFIFEILRIQ